jgi:ABC-type antimicrobial peptide transport system permease subunit
MHLARRLFGVAETGAHGILPATDNMYSSLPGSSFFTDLIERPIKKEALSHLSMVESIFTPPFLFFVAVALFASMLLLAQLFSILKDRRKFYLGVLRAIGVGNRQCFAVFVSECALLCALVVIAGVAFGQLLGYGLLKINAMDGPHPSHEGRTNR